MRIAVSGAHRTGKSTLLADLTDRLTGYQAVDEPYRLLEDDGQPFADPPSLDDVVEQLRRSIQVLQDDRAPDVLFDRCPVDLLAYALTHEDGDAFDLDEWLPGVRSAVETLDLVVFVPIERPDRVRVLEEADRRLRAAVHEQLESMLVDDSLGLGLEVLTVNGSTQARVAQVLRRIGQGRP